MVLANTYRNHEGGNAGGIVSTCGTRCKQRDVVGYDITNIVWHAASHRGKKLRHYSVTRTYIDYVVVLSPLAFCWKIAAVNLFCDYYYKFDVVTGHSNNTWRTSYNPQPV